PNLVNWATDIGLVIGFGAIAVDYLWLRTHKMHIRVIGFLISAIILGSPVGFIFPVENPIIPIPVILVQASFGLFGLAGLILVNLFYSALDIITKLGVGKNACAGVAPVIPGVDLPNSPISVPLHAWLSFVIILIVHEASHGFVIRKLGMKLKSYGLLLLGFLPIGAFVEPDDKEMADLEKKKPREALRVYAAGPASNFYFFLIGGIIFTLLGGFILGPLLMPAFTEIRNDSSLGVQVKSVEDEILLCGTVFETPAHNVLFVGDQITHVDGNAVNTIGQFSKAVAGKKSYTLTVNHEGTVSDHFFEPNDLGRIGINVADIPKPEYPFPWGYHPGIAVIGFITGFLGWLLLLNFLVATANFLPIDPFDGGKMVKLLILPYLGVLKMSEVDTKKLIGRFFSWVLLALIIINALPLIIVN
ncbi:MAG: site-2 protease family protein, partial [archaeon]